MLTFQQIVDNQNRQQAEFIAEGKLARQRMLDGEVERQRKEKIRQKLLKQAQKVRVP